MKDLLEDRLDSKLRYPIVHLSGEDIEVAITHTDAYGEDYQASSTANTPHKEDAPGGLS